MPLQHEKDCLCDDCYVDLLKRLDQVDEDTNPTPDTHTHTQEVMTMLSSKYIEMYDRVRTANSTDDLFIQTRISRRNYKQGVLSKKEMSSIERIIEIRRNWLDSKGR